MYRHNSSGRVQDIIADIIDRLPAELQSEACKLRCKLNPAKDMPEDKLSRTYIVEFEGASRQLLKSLDNVYRYIILTKD